MLPSELIAFLFTQQRLSFTITLYERMMWTNQYALIIMIYISKYVQTEYMTWIPNTDFFVMECIFVHILNDMTCRKLMEIFLSW